MPVVRYVWLILLAALHLLVAAGIAFWPTPHHELAFGLVLGTVAAQAALLAVITVWLPWSLAVRLPIALAGLAVSWLSIAANFLRDRSGAGSETVALIGMILGEYLGLVLVFWVARSVTDWRLTDRPTIDEEAEKLEEAPAEPLAAPPSESQFRIHHLLFWMALVAIVLALARVLLADLNFGQGPRLGEMIQVYALVTLFNALLALPLAAAALAPRLAQAGVFVVIVVLLWCPVVIAGQVGSLYLLLGPPGEGITELATVFAALDATQVILLGASLLLLRAQGFRLARSDEASS
jgi:hypothetical protein